MFGPDLHLPRDFTKESLMEHQIVGEPKDHVFEEVKRLYLDDFYTNLDNRMFPNLEEIIIDPKVTDLQAIGSMLIRWGKLRFVFSAGMREECVIPKEIKEIGYEAFAHTTFKKITLENPQVDIHVNAFDYSAWIAQDVSCLMIGHLAFRCKPMKVMVKPDKQCRMICYDKITIPENATEIDPRAFMDIKAGTAIYELETPVPLTQKMISLYRTVKESPIFCIEKYTLKSVEQFDPNTLYEFPCLSCIEILKENAAYKTLDGVLYSSDMKELIFYPPRKKGPFQIPASVEHICHRAFYHCEIHTLNIPKTVLSVAYGAFMDCNLRGVKIYEGSAFDLFEGLDTIPNKMHIYEQSGNDYILEHHNSRSERYKKEISDLWNIGHFSQETTELLRFKSYMRNHTEEKWNFALKKCQEQSRCQEYLDYIRKECKMKVITWIKEHQESEIVNFIRGVKEYLTSKEIQALLLHTMEEKLVVATAYLLECMHGVEAKPRESLEL